jgi:hypothetical protein
MPTPSGASALKPYTSRTYPTIEGSDRLYIADELRKISAAINQVIATVKIIDARLTAGGL